MKHKMMEERKFSMEINLFVKEVTIYSLVIIRLTIWFAIFHVAGRRITEIAVTDRTS